MMAISPQRLSAGLAVYSERLEPCLWLAGLNAPDIPLEPFRERLAKFLAPSDFIHLCSRELNLHKYTKSDPGD